MIRRERLNLLRAGFRERATQIADSLDAIAESRDWTVLVASTLRDPIVQERLYRQGRELIQGEWTQTGRVVTKARGWQSAHVYGLACDFALIHDHTHEYLHDDHPDWALIGRAAQEIGLVWGGLWRFRDCPHVEDPLWKELAKGEVEQIRQRCLKESL